MTTLMRNGRDRRSGKPVTCAMRDLSACFWLGPDQRITLGPAATAAAFKGRIHGCTRPRSLKCPIFPLHRGRRPYMAQSVDFGTSRFSVALGCEADIYHRAGDDRPDPRHAHQPLAIRVLARNSLDLAGQAFDALIEPPPVASQVLD